MGPPLGWGCNGAAATCGGGGGGTANPSNLGRGPPAEEKSAP